MCDCQSIELEYDPLEYVENKEIAELISIEREYETSDEEISVILDFNETIPDYFNIF